MANKPLRTLLSSFLLSACLSTLGFAQPMPVVVEMAKQQQWDALSALLADGLDANAVYGDGSTALHWAAYHNEADALRALLAAGAAMDAATDLGVTALWLAAENGNAETTGLLLSAGAAPDRPLHSGETALMTAAQAGSGGVVRALLSAGADPNTAVSREQTALMWAANRGHGDVVAALVEHGADVHARSLVREQYVKSEKEQDSHPAYKYWIEQGGNTPLIFAARAGDLPSTRHLVEAGSDVNALSAFGTSPAIMAIHGGNAQVLDYLLSQGADPESAASGHTALHAAVLRGDLAAVEVLLRHGADVEAILTEPTPTRRQSTDYSFHDALIGATPLWLAARFAEPAIMEALIAAGADPLVVNHVSFPAQRMGELYTADEGEISLLMAAVGMGHRRLRMSWGTPERRGGQLQDQQSLMLDAATLAVRAGVDPSLTDSDGNTALDHARARRYERVVAYLELIERH